MVEVSMGITYLTLDILGHNHYPHLPTIQYLRSFLWAPHTSDTSTTVAHVTDCHSTARQSAHPWARTLPQARPDPGNVHSSPEETLLISAERCIWLPHWKLHLLDHFGSISLYSVWDLITKFRPEVDSFKHVLMTFKDWEWPILWFPRQRRQVFSDSWSVEMSHIILDDESAIGYWLLAIHWYSLSSSFQSAAKCCRLGTRIMMVQPFNRLSLTVSSCRHRQRAMLYYVKLCCITVAKFAKFAKFHLKHLNSDHLLC